MQHIIITMRGNVMFLNLFNFSCGVILAFILSSHASIALAQSVKDAVEAAWARSPLGQSSAAQSIAFQAKIDVASQLLAAPPALSVGQRTDKFNNNRGVRETEIALALPIRTWGSREVETAVANTSATALESTLQHAKWQLAGQVREAYWATVLADIELKLAEAKSAQANKLAADISRRVAAGELTKVNEHRAAADKELAFVMQTELDFKFRQVVRQFTQLTGLVLGAAIAETASKKSFSALSHPAYIAQVDIIARTKATADAAQRVIRDPYELTLMTAREKIDLTESAKSNVRSSVGI
ncbi:MAG: TolC family protein, partial [Gammaproteobacteria bacterium]|nr:TolC family protein [Gammaproteobacteria bacterium]